MSIMNTNELDTLNNLLDSRQPNHGLPRPFYHDKLFTIFLYRDIQKIRNFIGK